MFSSLPRIKMSSLLSTPTHWISNPQSRKLSISHTFVFVYLFFCLGFVSLICVNFLWSQLVVRERPLFDLVRNEYFVLFDFPFRKPRLGWETKTIAKWSVALGVINSLSYLLFCFSHFVTPVIEGCLGRRSETETETEPEPIRGDGLGRKLKAHRQAQRWFPDPRPQTRFPGWVILS